MLFKLGGRSLKLDHTELMAKLLACCGTKSRKRFTWVPEGKKSSRPLAFAVVEEYFDYTIKETKEMLTVIENDDIMTYAEELGWEPAELKKLKKELEK